MQRDIIGVKPAKREKRTLKDLLAYVFWRFVGSTHNRYCQPVIKMLLFYQHKGGVNLITKEMIQSIKQNNVSKDAELTKRHVSEIWKNIPKEKLAEYGFTASSVLRAKAKGNMSVKLAAVLALLTGIDPYYLTAEAQDSTITADEERIIQFIISHGYQHVLGMEPAVQRRKNQRREKPNAEVSTTGSEPMKEESVSIYTSVPEAAAILTIQEYAAQQLELLSESELKVLNEMPEEDLSSLLDTLALQAKYSDNAKKLLGLLRLILISMDFHEINHT